MNTVYRPQGPGEVSTPGPGASTDQTPLVEADLEAHSEQSEEAPEIEAQGEGSLDTPSSGKENWTPKSVNGERSRRPEIAPGHINSIQQNSASSPAQ